MEGGTAPGAIINSAQSPRAVFPAETRNSGAHGGTEAPRPASYELSDIARAIPDGLDTPSFYSRKGKRLFDMAFSSLFLALLGFWLLPLIALAVRLDSKGPALFRQHRVGEGGKLFLCLKFRTMSHDPEAVFVQARKQDNRITRVGRILRKTNLDELPQFLNVLLGDMSVVGPRPHVPELDRLFGDLVPGYTQRTASLPGVTGLAQVSGCRGETRSVREMTHRIRFDLFYSRNVSLLLDLRIIVATVWCALAGDKKAY